MRPRLSSVPFSVVAYCGAQAAGMASGTAADSAARIMLDVVESNERARILYRRHHVVDVGAGSNDYGIVERRMVLELEQ